MGSNDDRLVYILRFLTFGCGVALIALGIVSFITLSLGDIRAFFLRIYYILFGILVCLTEMPCKRLLSFFNFLHYNIGKALFLLFLATITFTWSTVYYLIISIVFFCASGLYFFLTLSCYHGGPGEEAPPASAPKFEKREIEGND
jgi:hypothetical protein